MHASVGSYKLWNKGLRIFLSFVKKKKVRCGVRELFEEVAALW